jgi:hypothetical protein
MNTVQITTWSRRPRDFAPGRWVQLGAPTRLNFWLTGLPGGKLHVQARFPWVRYEPCAVKFEQHTTTWVSCDQLESPKGFGPDGWIKAVFGQRKIRQHNANFGQHQVD